MYAYAQRYKCKYNALLYPQSENIEPIEIDELYLTSQIEPENTVKLYAGFFNLNFDEGRDSKFYKQIQKLADSIR